MNKAQGKQAETALHAVEMYSAVSLFNIFVHGAASMSRKFLRFCPTLLFSCVRIAFECYLDALSSGPVNFGARASLPAASLAMRRVRGLRSSFFCSTIIIEFSLEANAVKATDTIFLKICVSFFLIFFTQSHLLFILVKASKQAKQEKQKVTGCPCSRKRRMWAAPSRP